MHIGEWADEEYKYMQRRSSEKVAFFSAGGGKSLRLKKIMAIIICFFLRKAGKNIALAKLWDVLCLAENGIRVGLFLFVACY
ncbi:hypothetical protein COU37_04130 [Candidatus Micrarchaeota archaeon CG10_big_fil_rev_8_21_14_0_10_45_29]|nr:MAG: hypothetical protein COU37_04130 [Candidatus Micrarchaeota archaeon CG10_big_fil_rev_8_21_14_0_10_45_29]